MTTTTITVEATLQPDGVTLHLEKKLALPPGRVTVTVQPTGPGSRPTMLEELDRIHRDQQQRGRKAMTEEEMTAEIAPMRGEDDEYEAAVAGNLVADRHEARKDGQPVRLVYIDAVICIYAVEGAPSFQGRARARLATLQAAGDQPAISDLSWLECRVKPIRLGDAVALTDMQAFLSGSDVVRVPMPTAVYDRACRSRAVHNYKLADELHLAAAIEGGCGLFLTNDHRLSGFADITVEVLS